MPLAVGLDFGTTNSAIAVATPDATVHLAAFQEDGQATTTFRSILYFFHPQDDEAGGRRVVAGPEAIQSYLGAEPRGRFIQSMKSFLASRMFEQTQLFHRTYRLEELIAIVVRELKTAAEAQFGDIGCAVVVGRPVHFAGARDEDDNSLALRRLQDAIQQGGFAHVSFEFEPVAAAAHYATRLDHDELVLIADFGGGTSDFSLLRLGPSEGGRASGHSHILGTAGIAVGGNDFDSRFIRYLVVPQLGFGTTYRSFEKVLPMPAEIYAELERWDTLSFLKTRQTLTMLQEIRARALEPVKIDGLLHVIEHELGYPLYKAVERTKFALSAQERHPFVFVEPPVDIVKDVTRQVFETWIDAYMREMGACIDALLEQCHIAPGEIDSIFMTGGSSFVPAVRRLFEQKFAADRLRRGGELTSVAQGLALCALRRSM
jgi:hypothetical chaperone protein